MHNRSDMRTTTHTWRAIGLVVVLGGLAGCGDNSAATCDKLFGAPSASTGLGSGQCQGRCDCVDFVPPTYSPEDIARFRQLELLRPFERLSADPYDSPDLHPDRSSSFCGVFVGRDGYWLETFDSRAALESAGAKITHHGACGQCSTLADLAVYLGNGDLAGPVRQCGLDTLGGGEPANTACLVEIGFTEPCAQIWAFNTINTRESCLELCFLALDDPYHQSDQSLNACIQCDEDMSGAVFKSVAGRTRRNSGVPSALCRPCDSVAPVVHDY